MTAAAYNSKSKLPGERNLESLKLMCMPSLESVAENGAKGGFCGICAGQLW